MENEKRQVLINHIEKHIRHNKGRENCGFEWDKNNAEVYRIALAALNSEQQRSLDHREFLLLSADQVQREYAEALGCAGDNESILEAIDDMKKRIAELEARAFNPAILDVIAERQRQQSVEGWTPEHDDEHSGGEMALAASSYALYAHRKPIAPAIPFNWPWEPVWFKQQGARRDLVKAGALILAEIERIDRAAGIGKGA